MAMVHYQIHADLVKELMEPWKLCIIFILNLGLTQLLPGSDISKATWITWNDVQKMHSSFI
jgi:hypothetical protein